MEACYHPCMNDPQPEGHMASHIGRRKFLATLGGAAAAWPLAARAQQPAMPVIGFLSLESPGRFTHVVAAFRRGLGEGRLCRASQCRHRLRLGRRASLIVCPALAAERASRPISVIAATGGPPSARAAKATSSTIPCD